MIGEDPTTLFQTTVFFNGEVYIFVCEGKGLERNVVVVVVVVVVWCCFYANYDHKVERSRSKISYTESLE